MFEKSRWLDACSENAFGKEQVVGCVSRECVRKRAGGWMRVPRNHVTDVRYIAGTCVRNVLKCRTKLLQV